MLRKTAIWKLLAAGLIVQSGAVLAQTPPAQTAPSQAPPKLERIEEGSDTPITITPRREQRNKIVERRDGGQVKEVKVTTGGSTYTMKGAGPATASTNNSEGAGSTLRPPQWQILEFDLSKRKQSEREAEATAAAAAAPPALVPPPPPPPAAK
ncbi:DUF2782 domain-containing protein [Massilia cavernae]|uniref:DUF2782 domain-containing protein n=1 Tax=Massilia cavernae TaxID=2320864 RepID=A0A418XSH9_9BURK|nr:DUF2782 domain-containing protein [Massilia cavernae]RJG15446.1 DUF2782 domain-containing protein [Massilia cavernae]